MEQNAKYLRVTIHDNDYRTSLEFICDALYEIFWFAGYPTEEDFPNLKKMYQAFMVWHSCNDQFIR